MSLPRNDGNFGLNVTAFSLVGVIRIRFVWWAPVFDAAAIRDCHRGEANQRRDLVEWKIQSANLSRGVHNLVAEEALLVLHRFQLRLAERASAADFLLILFGQ
jgi:hypothetical protein